MEHSLEELKSIIIITGEDYYLMSERRDSILSLLPSGKDDIDCMLISDADNLKDVFFDCFNLPFMSCKRIICISRTNALLSDEKKAFDQYIKAPSESAIILITDSNKVFKDYYKKVEHIDCKRLAGHQIIERTIDLVHSMGKTIDRLSADLLAQYTGCYMSRVDLEIRKLVAYVGERQSITQDDIKECVLPESDYQVYQLINAVSKSESNKALEISESLINSGMAPIILLSSLINQYRKLLHISLNIKEMNDNKLAEIFKTQPFVIAKDKEIIKNYTQQRLKKALDSLYSLEMSFKSGKITEEEAAKVAIVMLMSKEAK